MSKQARIIVLAGCLSLGWVAAAQAADLSEEQIKSISLQVLKAGGRANLETLLCEGDWSQIQQIDDRVHTAIDRNVNERPDLKLRASHEEMDLVMAEEALQDFMRRKRHCDPQAVAASKDELEVAIRGFDPPNL